jgi:hypothetical protein
MIIPLSNLTNIQNIEDESIQIAPNPTNGAITIVGLDQEITNISLFDLNGKKVLEKEHDNRNMNLIGLSEGVYFLVIYVKGKTISKKVVLSKH